MMLVIMVLANNTTSSRHFKNSCCGGNTISHTADAPRRAWLALAVMLVVVLRSSLICHTPVISSETAIEALIAGSYCSTSGNAPAPAPSGENSNDHVSCLHCATRRRITTSSAGESV
jgi:hypothetical protein